MDNDKISIGCVITPSNPATPLGITIMLDDRVLYKNAHVRETVTFTESITEVEGEQELKFILSGKTPEMTRVDAQGNILEDVTITISDITLDEINIETIACNMSVYEHNFNNTGDNIQEKFYGVMGCNGVARLKFSAPVYLWLLEHM